MEGRQQQGYGRDGRCKEAKIVRPDVREVPVKRPTTSRHQKVAVADSEKGEQRWFSRSTRTKSQQNLEKGKNVKV